MVKYLKGLDTLRAIAALVVVWVHLELLKKEQGLPNLIDLHFNLPSAHVGVILFFVLSGFLITFLLVKEREKEGKISFKKFYIRRILRIWPLYYIIIILSFLIFRVDYSVKTIALCLSIFPNIAHAIGDGWPTSPQIWSIGVEEQFYLLWPLALTLIPEKKTSLYLIVFFIGYSLLPHFIGFVNDETFQHDGFRNVINKFFISTSFNAMSIGALVGFLYAKNSEFLEYINNYYVAYISISLSVILWFSDFKLSYFTYEFYSLLFAVSIYNVVVNPKINIDTNLTSFIGKISYGVYMYHWIIILLVLKYIPIIGHNLIYNLVVYCSVFGLTLLISWVSYISVEKYFLDIKSRFETK